MHFARRSPPAKQRRCCSATGRRCSAPPTAGEPKTLDTPADAAEAAARIWLYWGHHQSSGLGNGKVGTIEDAITGRLGALASDLRRLPDDDPNFGP